MAAVTAAAVIGAGATLGAAALQDSGGSSSRPPNYNRQMRKGIATERELLPDKVESELQARAQFDPVAMQQRIDLMGQSSGQVTQQMLDAQGEFAPQFLDLNRSLVNQANPYDLGIRDQLGSNILEELKRGRGLTDAQDAQLKDSFRAAQVARGITHGDAPALGEAMAVQQFGEQLYQQRLNNAGTFLSSTPNLQQMSQGLPTGYNPQESADTFRLFDPRAGQSAAQFAQQSYATQAANVQPNPWVQGLGMIGGAAVTAAGNAWANKPQPMSNQQFQQTQQAAWNAPSYRP